MIKTVGVIGAGTMGNGIAQVFAQAGFSVRLVDVAQPMLDRARGDDREEPREVRREGQADAPRTATRRSAACPRRPSIDDARRRRLRRRSDRRERRREARAVHAASTRSRGPTSILASNTSSISITAARRRDQAARQRARHALHEPGAADDARRADSRPGDVGRRRCGSRRSCARRSARRRSKRPTIPGFIANRILMPMINEAIFAVMEGVGTPEAIDAVMKLGMNHPMGPLTLADFIGLDVCLAILNVLHDGLGDPKYRPCPLLRRMVAAGQLGRKSGRGFYTYASHERRQRSAPRIAISCDDRASAFIASTRRREEVRARSVCRNRSPAGDEPAVAERPQQLDAERRMRVGAEPVEQQCDAVRGRAHQRDAPSTGRVTRPVTAAIHRDEATAPMLCVTVRCAVEQQVEIGRRGERSAERASGAAGARTSRRGGRSPGAAPGTRSASRRRRRRQGMANWARHSRPLSSQILRSSAMRGESVASL